MRMVQDQLRHPASGLTQLLMVLLLISIAFSSIAANNDDNKTSRKAKDRIVTVAPNPVQSGRSVDILYHLPDDGNISFRVMDGFNRMVFYFEDEFPKGDNNIILNTNGFKSGQYLIQITSDGHDEEIKLDVQ